MKKYLLISLLFLSSCEFIDDSADTSKTFSVNNTTYTVYKGTDSCEYYSIKTATAAGSKNNKRRSMQTVSMACLPMPPSQKARVDKTPTR